MVVGLLLIVSAVQMLLEGKYGPLGWRGAGGSMPASEGIPMCLSASFIGLLLVGTGLWWIRMDDGE